MSDVERVARLEVYVTGLREDLNEIKEVLKAQAEVQNKLTSAIDKWKQGLGIVFAFGAIAMWVIDHWNWVISHFKA